MSAIDRFLDALRLNPDEDYDDDYEDDDYGIDEPDEPDERELRRQAARERKQAMREQKAREREEAQEAKARMRQEEAAEKERKRAQRAEETEMLEREVRTERRNMRDSERVSATTEKPVTAFRTTDRTREASRTQSKITPMTAKTTRKQSFTMDEVCVIKPTNFKEETEITDTILSGKPVIINMEGLDIQVAQRIVDFTLGATYALNGNFQRITNSIFLATPNGVDISGDITGEGDLDL